MKYIIMKVNNKYNYVAYLKNWSASGGSIWSYDIRDAKPYDVAEAQEIEKNYLNLDPDAITLKTTLDHKYGLLSPSIQKVIFNDPATIILWSNGQKTVVKCNENEEYDPEKGLAMAISKYVLGNQGNYYNEFKKWLPESEENSDDVWGWWSKLCK